MSVSASDGEHYTSGFIFNTAAVSISPVALALCEMPVTAREARATVWRVPATEGIVSKGDTNGSNWRQHRNRVCHGRLQARSTDRRFRCLMLKTGKKLWETTMDASGAATPITYMGKDGKQYVVIAAGGGTSAGSKAASDEGIACVCFNRRWRPN